MKNNIRYMNIEPIIVVCKKILLISIILGIFLAICVGVASAVYLDANGNIDWSKYGAGAASSSSQPANTVDKELTSIDNCYEVTIYIEQTSGNSSPVYFKDCTDEGGGVWICNCRDFDGDFNIVMQTDATPLRKERKYKVTMNYTIYDDRTRSKDSFTVKDFGDYADTSGIDSEVLGRDVVTVDNIVYVNHTDIQIEYRNNTLFRDVIKEVYVENMTHIKSLQDDIDRVNGKNKTITMLLVLAIVIIVGLAYWLWKKGSNGLEFETY